MAFAMPNLADLAASVRAAFRAELPGADANLWPNNLGPTAKVFAGALWAVYLRLDYIAQQIFAASAEGQWLDRHAVEYGMARLPASAATGTVAVTATGAVTIASGTVLTRADGARFLAVGVVALAGAGTASVAVVAEAVGKAGNSLAGTALAASSGVTGPATFAVDAAGLGGGSDVEADAALRARVLFRKRNPPQGGAAADYVSWASAVPGVTRVFVERLWAGPGTIRVFPLTDNATAGGVPVAASLAAVQAALAAQAPAGANVTVGAAAPQVVAVTVTGLSPDTPAVREAVLAELRDAVRRLGRVAGSDTPVAGLPFLATAQTFSRSWIWQAIANAAGEERHAVTVPAADVTIVAGAIPVLGAVTFA